MLEQLFQKSINVGLPTSIIQHWGLGSCFPLNLNFSCFKIVLKASQSPSALAGNSLALQWISFPLQLQRQMKWKRYLGLKCGGEGGENEKFALPQ